jgi:hypothetical protein
LPTVVAVLVDKIVVQEVIEVIQAAIFGGLHRAVDQVSDLIFRRAVITTGLHQQQ